jgi:trans-2,3-dihydro-3-hydroxyanthranilate isomerase
VFTSTPLEGNALAVFPDAGPVPPERMQALAREMNLSETVFVLPAEGDGDVRLRIFTPVAELPFAGHPVLGTAIVLGGSRDGDALRLETGLGTVPVRLERRNGEAVSGRMEQFLPEAEPYEDAAAMLAALGVARSELPVEAYANGPRHVFVTLADEAAVAALRPDIGALARLGPVCANCVAGSGSRWKSRMFAPGLGVNEDPATGSAAGPLAVHLVRHGRIVPGREIEISQGAEIGRPSRLLACAHGSGGRIERVEVAGSAGIVARGRHAVG